MTILDIVVVLALAVFFFKGFSLGLVRAVGTFIGLIVGLWLAGHYYQAMGDWLVGWGLPEAFSAAAGYIATFIAAVWAVSILVWMADRVFKFLAIIPGMKLANNVLGGVVLLVVGVVIVGVVLYVVGQFSAPGSSTKLALERARVAPMVTAAAWLAAPLIPTAIEQYHRVAPSAQDLMPGTDEVLGDLPSPWKAN